MKNQDTMYSPLFSTVHDEKEPIGILGRGTHYSIFKTAQFLNNLYQPQHPLKIQIFCVLWDEDHDTRIIEVIEKLYIENMLAPILFIGERKGGVNVIVDKIFYDNADLRKSFEQKLDNIAQSLDDPWCSDLGYMDITTKVVNPEAIIKSDQNKVSVYLNNIYNLWSLGQKEY